MATRNKVSTTTPGKRNAAMRSALSESLNPDQPVFPYPPDLREDFKDIWRQTVNTKTGDYWSKGDIPLLMLYCRCAHDINRLDQEIADEGETIENARGNMVVNPKIVIRGFAETRFMSLCSKLHMQPASRVDSKNEKNQGAKKARANKAAQTVSEDGDDLLAGSHGMMQ